MRDIHHIFGFYVFLQIFINTKVIKLLYYLLREIYLFIKIITIYLLIKNSYLNENYEIKV